MKKTRGIPVIAISDEEEEIIGNQVIIVNEEDRPEIQQSILDFYNKRVPRVITIGDVDEDDAEYIQRIIVESCLAKLPGKQQKKTVTFADDQQPCSSGTQPLAKPRDKPKMKSKKINPVNGSHRLLANELKENDSEEDEIMQLRNRTTKKKN